MISIAIDFDGTLVEDKFPEIGREKTSTIELVKELKKLGVKIILWTCRNGEMLQRAVDLCKEHGLEFDAVNSNLPEVQAKWGGDTRKVYADYYFDDKNLGGIKFEKYKLRKLKMLIEKVKGGE